MQYLKSSSLRSFLPFIFVCSLWNFSSSTIIVLYSGQVDINLKINISVKILSDSSWRHQFFITMATDLCPKSSQLKIVYTENVSLPRQIPAQCMGKTKFSKRRKSQSEFYIFYYLFKTLFKDAIDPSAKAGFNGYTGHWSSVIPVCTEKTLTTIRNT